MVVGYLQALVVHYKIIHILKPDSAYTCLENNCSQTFEFNDNIRSLLVDNIINYIITNKLTMSVSLADCIGKQIVAMFPSEVKVSI